jgi:hypothetical protein
MEDGWKEPSNNSKKNPKRKNKFSVKKRIGKRYRKHQQAAAAVAANVLHIVS